MTEQQQANIKDQMWAKRLPKGLFTFMRTFPLYLLKSCFEFLWAVLQYARLFMEWSMILISCCSAIFLKLIRKNVWKGLINKTKQEIERCEYKIVYAQCSLVCIVQKTYKICDWWTWKRFFFKCDACVSCRNSGHCLWQLKIKNQEKACLLSLT